MLASSFHMILRLGGSERVERDGLRKIGSSIGLCVELGRSSSGIHCAFLISAQPRTTHCLAGLDERLHFIAFAADVSSAAPAPRFAEVGIPSTCERLHASQTSNLQRLGAATASSNNNPPPAFFPRPQTRYYSDEPRSGKSTRTQMHDKGMIICCVPTG